MQLSFGGRLVNRIFEEFKQLQMQTKIVQRILSSNKTVPEYRKKGLYTSRMPKN
jgi:hypothetical protein